MVDVARKNLLEERSRFILGSGGLAFALFLVLLLSGIFNAISVSTLAYFQRTPADIWVAQKGTPAAGLASVLPADLKSKIQNVSGIRSVDEILISRSFVKAGNSDAGVILVAPDPDSNVGGPFLVVSGASKPGRGDVVIDKTFARIYGYKIGDAIEILGNKFNVTGLSDQTNLLFAAFVFLNIDDLTNLLHLNSVVSYFLVHVNDGSTIDSVANSISTQYDVETFTKQEVVSANLAAAQRNILPILYVMDAVGFVVGTAVIALTTYTLTFEKIREYAVLRALGASRLKLVSIVFEQSIILALIGFAIGLAASVALGQIIEIFVPQVTVVYLPSTVLDALLLTVIMSLVSSYLPIRRITRADPALVFRR